MTWRREGLWLAGRARIGARAGVGLLLAGLASMALASPAQGQDGIEFERCPGPAAEDWECATHTVPLDHSGERSGTIDLAVRRFRPEGTRDPSDRPPFIALAGGPGQSGISVADLFAEVFGGHGYQLIVYDQRGTGLSGALTCEPLAAQANADDPTQEDASAREVAACARELGSRRAFYTTLDSVEDIDSLRQALDAETIGIGGVSYGTYVSAVYAQQYPERTERIVLDSVVSPSGDDVFQRPTLEAVQRVVTEQCDGGACARTTANPLGDLSQIAGQLRSGRITGTLYTPAGRPRQAMLDSEFDLLQSMIAGDLDPALRAGQPAAFRAAARGDATPLLRFVRIVAATAGAQGQIEDGEEGLEFSSALFSTTVCTDNTFPWPASMAPGEERDRVLRNAFAGVPQSETWPFGRQALRRLSLASDCRLWPLTDSAPPPDHPPFPNVPTLIVNGSADLRTPNSSAIEAQRDFAPGGSLILVEGQGHSVLGSGCADTALERFFADQPVGDPCRDVDQAEPVQPLAPLRIRGVPRVRGMRGARGRTFGAALATVADMRWVHRVLQRPFQIGGLRGGSVTFQRRPRTRFILRQLSYVPGVRLAGTLRFTADRRLIGRVRVRGRRAVTGSLRFRANGRVIAWLRGQRIARPDPTR